MRAVAPLISILLLLEIPACSQVIEVSGQAPAADRVTLDAPRMEAVFEARNLREGLSRVSRRDGFEIWRTDAGDTITLREGIVFGTLALTPDLFSVEAAVPSDWRFAARPVLTDRVHRYVDGDENVVIRGYVCEVSASVPDSIRVSGRSRAAERTDETCYNATQSFTNSYWLDGSGRMVQSRQWLGPEVGYLRLNHLLP